MAPTNTSPMAFISSHSINPTSEIRYSGSQALPSPVPRLNASIDDQIIWKLSAPDPPDEPEDPCYQYYERQKEESKKRITVPLIDGYHDHSLDLLVDAGHSHEWNRCHLLSLPKELRLEIWEYVLTDPSIPEILVHISRQQASPYLRHARPLAPKFNISPRRHVPINVNLLRANRFIYEEALPILYKSAKFAPLDLEGLLPQFLGRLSPYAQSLIRRIKLHLPEQVTSPVLRLDPSRPFFHWAITCAQVAKINANLQELEIQGEWAIFANEANRRAVLSPLCKIKAAKNFTPLSSSSTAPEHYNEQFQMLLEEVAEHLKAVAEVRSERTKADIMRAAQQAEIWKQIREAERTAYLAAEAEAETNATEHQDGIAFHRDIDEELSVVAGIEQFEQELKEHILPDYKPSDSTAKEESLQTVEDWDLVSLKSGMSTPRVRPASVISKMSDGTWTDTASTIVGRDEIAKENDSDAESETWEEL